MQRHRCLEEMHFVCHDRQGVEDENNETFTTGRWVVRPELVRPERKIVVALHETRAAPSYLQGTVQHLERVVEGTTASGRRQRRVVLRIKKSSTPFPWKGKGSGEKGYVWARTTGA